MTDTRIVNGQEVIATERVPSNLSKRKDRPQVYFTSVEKLLLADDTVVFACVQCDFTADKAGQVRFHHSTEHRGKKMGNPGKNGRRTEPELIVAGPVAKRTIEVEPEGFDEVDEDDILAALEAALNGAGDSEQVAALEQKIAALEAEIDQLKRENKTVTGEREWWKEEAGKARAKLKRLSTALQAIVKDGK